MWLHKQHLETGDPTPNVFSFSTQKHHISTVPRILAAPPDRQGLTFLPAAIVACASADKHQKMLQLRREVELLPGQQIYCQARGFFLPLANLQHRAGRTSNRRKRWLKSLTCNCTYSSLCLCRVPTTVTLAGC